MSWTDFDPFTRNALEFLKQNQSLTELVVFLLGFAESIAFISLFVPSTVLFLGIGTMHSAAGGSYIMLTLAGGLGAFLGDIVSYAAGYYFKDRVAQVWPFSKSPELLPRSRAMIEKYGIASVFVGKFMGLLRPFVPVVAGVMYMPWLTFGIASAVSSVMWAGVFLAPGYGLMQVWK